MHDDLDSKILNLYANGMSYSDIQENLEEIYNVPIGSPIQNLQVYILNQHMQPVPVGVAGEIYVGGTGTARGYLNKSELTKEKFISNPFAQGRLYKSGDLARWLNDGNIEYFGRNDFQVKIRGQRLELGEIELALSEYQDIKQNVVVINSNNKNNNYLVGYYVANNSIDEQDLKISLPIRVLTYLRSSSPIFSDETISGSLFFKASICFSISTCF